MNHEPRRPAGVLHFRDPGRHPHPPAGVSALGGAQRWDMASFRLPVDRATLLIDEGPWSGVEVEVDRAAGPLVRSQLVGLMEADTESDAAQIARGRELFDLLETRVILGWNIANHAGKPIRPTARGFALVPPELIATVIGLYLHMTAPDEPEAGAPVPAPVNPPPGEVPTFGPVPPTP